MLMFSRLGFSADILKRKLYTKRKVHFSHLSQLGIGYQLWCYRYWEIWGYDLFVEKSHSRPGFQQHNSGVERSSVQLLIRMICWFHCLDRRFFFLFQENKILTSQESWDSCPCCNSVPTTHKKWFTRSIPKHFWMWLLPYPSQPLLISLINFLTDKCKIISSCICVYSTLLTFLRLCFYLLRLKSVQWYFISQQ